MRSRVISDVRKGAGHPSNIHTKERGHPAWGGLSCLEGLGRLVAPDLVGMGDSAKLADSGPGRYRLVEHRRYLDGLMKALGITRNVVLVVHDWGSALA